MKQIPLTQGKFALVDDEDFEYLNQWKWHTSTNGLTMYATGHEPKANGVQKTIIMHRLIMGLKHGDGLVIDHINHDGLDNRRSNLRICTQKENMRNRTSLTNSSSKHLGVTFYKDRVKAWRALIRVDGELNHIGYFQTEEQAAMAYNERAQKAYGEFASLNTI